MRSGGVAMTTTEKGVMGVGEKRWGEEGTSPRCFRSALQFAF